MATYLLVHGAFQGGWVWHKVVSILQNQGHVVHAPTLSGCGYLYSDIRTEHDLMTFIGDIQSYLDIENLDDVILVGHSYSGMICGAVMMQSPQRIRQAIFVDAIIPQSNRSFVDIAGEQFKQMLDHHRVDNDLVRPWPVKVFGISGPEAVWFDPHLRPFSYQAFHTKFPGLFEPSIRPLSYIGCRKTMSPFIREMAAKAKDMAWPVHELDTGHCPMITCPEALVELFSTIVKEEDAAQ